MDESHSFFWRLPWGPTFKNLPHLPSLARRSTKILSNNYIFNLFDPKLKMLCDFSPCIPVFPQLCFSCSLYSCCVTQDNVLIRLCHGNRPLLWGFPHTMATGIETIPLLGLGIKVFLLLTFLLKFIGRETALKKVYYYRKRTSLFLLVLISNLRYGLSHLGCQNGPLFALSHLSPLWTCLLPMPKGSY